MRLFPQPQYGVETRASAQVSRPMITKEVLTMITLVSPIQSRPAVLAVPTSGCVDAVWRAHRPVMGDVTVLATAAKRVRVFTTDVYGTTSGTSAWSPPI